MEGSVGAPPQRVCPKCARISWATGPQCPYCTANFRRSGGVAPWMLVVTALVVLLGVGVMFYVTVREVDKQVDDVTNTVNSNFTRLRADVQRQLDAIPQTGTVPVPTVTPVPTEAPTVDPGTEVTPEPTPTATVEGETTPDPGADSTPTPEEPAIINP